MNKVALISVFDKTGVAGFAKELADLGWKIYASGGTAKEIAAAKVPVKDVAELVGGEAILGHRVVTLSREIHAGLLADKSQEAELKKLGIPKIDLVCVDLYPLEQTINDSKSKDEDVIEMTDIGGPTMLRSAAKGRRIVISRPEQRELVIDWLKNGKPEEKNFLTALAATAEFEVAKYVYKSAKYWGGDEFEGFLGQRLYETKYGENPWQTNAGFYSEGLGEDKLGLDYLEQLSGTELSYNNYSDIDRLLQTMTHIAAGLDKNFGKVESIALGAKHGNVCGAATSDSKAEAMKNMLDGDSRAIFGGCVMLNFAVDKTEAKLLLEHSMDSGKRLLDVIVAPEFSDAAVEILQRKGGKLRLVTLTELANLNQASLDQQNRFRYVRGGALAQQNYDLVLDLNDKEVQKASEADLNQQQDMVMAWAIGSTSNSNTVTLVKDGMLLGNGVGQQDRITACELALKRAKDAGHNVKGAVAYSDSFFPFPDGPMVLANAGVKAIFATRGSVNDDKVAEELKKAGVIFYSLPDSDARGFYAH